MEHTNDEQHDSLREEKMEHTNDEQRESLPDEKRFDPSHLVLRRARASLLPRDFLDLVIVIGVFAGIGHYIATQDSWLLLTFLGLLMGGAIERSRQVYNDY